MAAAHGRGEAIVAIALNEPEPDRMRVTWLLVPKRSAMIMSLLSFCKLRVLTGEKASITFTGLAEGLRDLA